MLLKRMYDIGFMIYTAFSGFLEWLATPIDISILDGGLVPGLVGVLEGLGISAPVFTATPLDLMFGGVVAYCTFIFVEWVLDLVL